MGGIEAPGGGCVLPGAGRKAGRSPGEAVRVVSLDQPSGNVGCRCRDVQLGRSGIPEQVPQMRDKKEGTAMIGLPKTAWV